MKKSLLTTLTCLIGASSLIAGDYSKYDYKGPLEVNVDGKVKSYKSVEFDGKEYGNLLMLSERIGRNRVHIIDVPVDLKVDVLCFYDIFLKEIKYSRRNAGDAIVMDSAQKLFDACLSAIEQKKNSPDYIDKAKRERDENLEEVLKILR